MKPIFKGKTLLFNIVVVGFIVEIAMFSVLVPRTINADLTRSNVVVSQDQLVKNGHLTICKVDKSSYEVVRKINMIVTAYSSTPDQTDDTPFITASGKSVADGIIANNMLPFGTKVKIPEIYGDKIFVVEDRMNQKKGNYMADIWMSTRSSAKDFGAKSTQIEVIES